MYLALKLVHILAAIVAVGTNVTYFFWLRQAKTPGAHATTALDGIKALDRWLANPAYVVLPVTGVIMVLISALEFSTFWVATAIVLFIVMGAFAGIFFAPALRRQVELARTDGGSDAYSAAARRTTVTGAATMVLVFAIVTLMVTKPN
ncbi:MAG: DUF2269 family protein [Nitriliruptorales bacterium]|nr:DUF2269 family protein [Nitriliruptorales bacterium]